MSPRTSIVLAAAIVLLALVGWWQLAREGAAASTEVALFEGLQRARIVGLRIEDLTHGQQLRLERDSSGRWKLTDPESVRADASLVEHLLASLEGRRATPVPAAQADARKLGFEPPRAVLEIEEDLGGSLRRERLELGALDPDGQRVNVRVHGQLLSTWRDLDTTLGRPLADFRSHQLLQIDARDVIEIHRQGRVAQPSGQVFDAGLEALADAGVWRVTAPVEGQLDPLGMSIWTSALAQLRIAAYLDQGVAPLARYGLDPPEVTLSAGGVMGTLASLRFGRASHDPAQPWTCSVEGDARIYAIDAEAAGLLTTSVEELLDHRLLRLTRDSIDGLVLVSRRGTLEVERTKKDWRVRLQPRGEDAPGEWQPAERSQVEALLTQLDELEFQGFDRDARLEPAEIDAALTVRAGEAKQGGVLGKPFEVKPGARGVHFRRDGDRVVAVADAALHELATLGLERLLSLRIVSLVEVEQRRLVIEDGRTVRRYVRNPKGLWAHEGFETEARELREVLDGLVFPRAERHLAPNERVELVQSISVSFVDGNNQEQRYVVARGAAGPLAGRVIFQREGRLSLARDAQLHERLQQLLAGG